MSGTPSTDLDLASILATASSFVTTEYASLTRVGEPVTWPVTPYRGETGATIDVTTGLAYPLKAERARRNPQVALSFTHPLGSGLTRPPAIVVQGLATVRDADLRGGSARYLRAASERFPHALARTPLPLLRRMAFYWTRIWIQVHPVRVLWWEDGDLSRPPTEWRAAPSTVPPSDPEPSGTSSGSWRTSEVDWRRRASRALEELGPPVLTAVDGDGWPLPVPVRSARPTADGFAVVPPAGVELRQGPAFLTFHSHAEVFDGQQNIGLAGTARSTGAEIEIRVHRALADWGVSKRPVTAALDLWRTGRRLTPRLEVEARRRNQRPPTFDELGFTRPSASTPRGGSGPHAAACRGRSAPPLDETVSEN